MHNITEFNLENVMLTGVELGRGKNTVYLLHGVTANHFVWEPIYRELSQYFRVIAVDQRGHGRSEKPEGKYSADEYASDLLSLVDRYGAGGLNILVGHSLGARNSIVAGARFGSPVQGVVAIDFTPFIEPEVFNSLAKRVEAGDRTFDSQTEVRKYLANRYVNLPEDAIDRRASYGYLQEVDGQLRPLASSSAMASTVDGLRAELSTHLESMSVPALIVRGSESTLVSKEALRRSAECAPQHRYTTIYDADHYVPEEKPAEVAALIREFVRSIK